MVGRLDPGDDRRRGEVVIGPHPTVGHLHAVDRLGGVDQARGDGPERGLVQHAELGHHRLGGSGERRHREVLQALIQPVALGLRSIHGLDVHREPPRDLVGDPDRLGDERRLESGAVAESLRRRLERRRGLDPAGHQVARGAGARQQVTVGLDAGRARLQRGGLGPHAVELGEHLGVLAACQAVACCTQVVIERLQLRGELRRLVLSRDGGLELGRQLLQGGARLAQLGRLALPRSGARLADVASPDDHGGAQRVGSGDDRAEGHRCRRAVVVVARLEAARLVDERGRAPDAVDVAQRAGLLATREGAQDALRQRLPLEQAEPAQDGQARVEPQAQVTL